MALRVSLPRGWMWDLPMSGIKLCAPALASGFLTTSVSVLANCCCLLQKKGTRFWLWHTRSFSFVCSEVVHMLAWSWPSDILQNQLSAGTIPFCLREPLWISFVLFKWPFLWLFRRQSCLMYMLILSAWDGTHWELLVITGKKKSTVIIVFQEYVLLCKKWDIAAFRNFECWLCLGSRK